jgi:DNA repair protein RecO (recombination protein O)
MRTYTVTGIVIKRTNFSEADRIVTIFTSEYGKLTVVAKGIRKLTSHRSGSLELFNHIRATVVQGRGQLDTLAEVEVIDTFSSWRHHLGRISVAYELVELVDKLTADRQPLPSVYILLAQSLDDISSLDANWQSDLHTWTLDLVRELGFWPKDKPFAGDLQQFVSEISSHPLMAHNFLRRKLTNASVNRK